jgi:hypothetical protein
VETLDKIQEGEYNTIVYGLQMSEQTSNTTTGVASSVAQQQEAKGSSRAETIPTDLTANPGVAWLNDRG